MQASENTFDDLLNAWTISCYQVQPSATRVMSNIPISLTFCMHNVVTFEHD